MPIRKYGAAYQGSKSKINNYSNKQKETVPINY